MIVTLVTIVIGITFLELGKMDSIVSARDANDVAALAAAEAGLERARAISDSQNLAWSSMTYNGNSLSFAASADPVYSGNNICTLISNESVAEGAATYSVVIEELGGQSYRIHGIGTAGNSTCRITMEGATATAADYVWFTNDEGNLYFSTDDLINGVFYTNDQLWVNGSPVFMGEVYTGASEEESAANHSSNTPDFQESIEYDAEELDMTALLADQQIDIIEARALEANGIYLESNEGRPYEIKFLSNGKITVKRRRVTDNDNTNGWEVVLNNQSLSSTNGAIFVDEDVQVRGSCSGEVTIATSLGNDIIITHDLTYSYPSNYHSVFDEDFDPSDPDMTDKLGLVSGGDIVIDTASSSDFYVMASLVALYGTLRNENYNTKNGQALSIFGALAQDEHGPVGANDGLGSKGFTKYYKYDDRLSESPPPYYLSYGYNYTSWRLTE